MKPDFRVPHGVFQAMLLTFSVEPSLSGALGDLELAEDVGDVVLDGLEAKE